MDCLALDTTSYLSTFLEDFQDKNSHLFPSADLSSSLEFSDAHTFSSCGSKRSRDTAYDAFSSWNEELLSDGLEVSSNINNATGATSVKQEQAPVKAEPAQKKRKLSEDSEFALFLDARSRSPPFQSLSEFECTDESALSTPLPPAAVPGAISPAKSLSSEKAPTTPVLCSVLGSIGKLNGNVRESIMSSLQRLATKATNGRNPLMQSAQSSSALSQVDSSIDYLTMQTLFGAPPSSTPALSHMKSTSTAATTKERSNSSFYPATGGIPFVFNPYAMSSPSLPLNCIIPKAVDTSKQPQASLATYQNIYLANQCTKPLLYSDSSAASSQATLMNTHRFVPSQSMYSQQAVVHV